MLHNEARKGGAEREQGRGGTPPWRAVFAFALVLFAASVFGATWLVLDTVRARSSTNIDLAHATLVDGGPTLAAGVAAPAVDGAGYATSSIDDPKLLAAITGVLGDQAAHYGVVVRRLRDGRMASLNGDQVFYAASTFKLSVLYEAEVRRTEGTLNFNDPLTLTADDISQDLGTLRLLGLGPDNTLSIARALRAMVTLSDNSTAVALLHLLGEDNIDTTLTKLGLTNTRVNTTNLPTTAADMERLMEAIVRGRGLGASEVADARDLLLHQETRSGIPAGLPANVRVGNKTGTWPDATHDVAFVDAPNGTYVIAVLSDKGWAWDPIREVSKAVYDVLQSE